MMGLFFCLEDEIAVLKTVKLVTLILDYKSTAYDYRGYTVDGYRSILSLCQFIDLVEQTRYTKFLTLNQSTS